MALGLIIEPDPMDRSLIARCFRDEGLNVVETSCAIEGLSWIWTCSLAIVACSERLPEMAAYHVLQTLREHDECRRAATFYIISSSLADIEDHTFFKYRPDGVWQKPLHVESIATAVKQIYASVR